MAQTEAEMLRDFRKSIQEMRRESKIKECFHPTKSECDGPIKQAHSLQRNGRLSLIEDDVNGQNQLYTITSFRTSSKRFITDFIPVGKKVASTFYGFCGKHDTDVFSPIENLPFDDSEKHLFLHSYRSFAHSYHRKKEELKLYNSDWEVMKQMPKWMRDDYIRGAEIALKEMEPEKQLLDNKLVNEEYGGLDYLVLETNDFYPFGCSTQINPHYTVKDEPIDDWDDLETPYTTIMLTVIPDKSNSLAVLACFREAEKGVTFLDHLAEIDEGKAFHAVSSMMTILNENTFWSPKLWDALGKDAKTAMINDANFIQEKDRWSKFPWSSLNLYNPRFTASNLGIVK